MTHFIHTNRLTLAEMVNRMSRTPAQAFNLPGGTLREGSVADVTVIDPEAVWRVDPSKFLSKSRNTPFVDWPLKGRPLMTIVDGRVVWERAYRQG
jgi:dihydroorotase